MNSFKEWLSDYLRYFILGLAMLLSVLVIVLGVRIYQRAQASAQTQGDPSAVEILTEVQTEAVSGNETVKTGETEETGNVIVITRETVTERTKETETGTPEIDSSTSRTEDQDKTETDTSGQAGDGGGQGIAVSPSTEKSAETNVPETKTPETKAPETKAPETKAPETNPPETKAPQTDPPQTDPPQPVYLTINSTCYFRSYADYGDNIIGEYPAGTVVEFLEDVGGWYKVQIDGVVGYMGARFLQ